MTLFLTVNIAGTLLIPNGIDSRVPRAAKPVAEMAVFMTEQYFNVSCIVKK